MMITTGVVLKPGSIGSRGDVHNERLLFEVTQDANLGYYVLIATRETSSGRVYAGSRAAYWFEAREVKAGDNVIVYTRAGQDTTQRGPDGRLNHFYYWGLTHPLFSDSSARVVIAELSTWETAG
jgi:hypothetical protein